MYIIKNTLVSSYVIRNTYRNGIYETPESLNPKSALSFDNKEEAEELATELSLRSSTKYIVVEK